MTTTTTPPAVTGAPYGRTQSEAYTVTTVLLLVAGGFVVPVVGWLAGVVMLWAGDRWSVGAKWLGTLVWPGVVALVGAAALAVGVTTGSHAGLVLTGGVGVLVAVVLLPWVFVHLLRVAR